MKVSHNSCRRKNNTKLLKLSIKLFAIGTYNNNNNSQLSLFVLKIPLLF